MNKWKNDLPVRKINPQRRLPSNDADLCSEYALSCFQSSHEAISFFNELLKTYKRARQTVGTHYAELLVTMSDGVMTNPDEVGHIDLFEFSGVAWDGRVSIKGML